MTLVLRSARSLSLGERAKLFTAAYEGYAVPMHVDEAALCWMQEKLDFDLDASRIACRYGEPVELANLAVRGQEAWIGGVAVVESARRSRVGEPLLRAVHEEARSLGVDCRERSCERAAIRARGKGGSAGAARRLGLTRAHCRSRPRTPQELISGLDTRPDPMLIGHRAIDRRR